MKARPARKSRAGLLLDALIAVQAMQRPRLWLIVIVVRSLAVAAERGDVRRYIKCKTCVMPPTIDFTVGKTPEHDVLNVGIRWVRERGRPRSFQIPHLRSRCYSCLDVPRRDSRALSQPCWYLRI